MKRFPCIAALFWLTAAFAADPLLPEELPDRTEISEPARKPASADKTVLDSDIAKILAGKEQLPEVTENELENQIDRKARSLIQWLEREKKQLFRSLIGSGIILLIGAGMSWVRHRICKRFPPENASLHWQLTEALTPPLIAVFVICGIFAFWLPVLHALPELYPWDARLFFTLLTLLTAWAGFRLISLADLRLTRIARRTDNNLDTLMVEITQKFLKISLASFTVLFIGQSIFDLNITTLLAGAGVVGLAVAFASRETLSNFFGTLVIILDRPFRVGDRIRINEIDGLVESVGMRSTRLQTAEESCVSIPNSRIAEASIENISARGVIRYAFTLGFEYITTADQLERIIPVIHEVVDNFEGADQKRYHPRVFFSEFGNSALNVRVIMWLKTTDFATEEAWRTRINLQLMRKISEAGLSLAYNTVTTYLRGEPEYPLIAEAGPPPATPKSSKS